MIHELERAGCLDGTSLAWSMWAGYLAQPRSRVLSKRLETHGIATHQLHSSGHATVADLQQLAGRLGGRVVPIHTSAPTRFREHFENVELHPDGEWWDV
jgi:ribonuclease J